MFLRDAVAVKNAERIRESLHPRMLTPDHRRRLQSGAGREPAEQETPRLQIVLLSGQIQSSVVMTSLGDVQLSTRPVPHLEQSLTLRSHQPDAIGVFF